MLSRFLLKWDIKRKQHEKFREQKRKKLDGRFQKREKVSLGMHLQNFIILVQRQGKVAWIREKGVTKRILR